jgi:chemotaxis protein methyltransferase CheR
MDADLLSTAAFDDFSQVINTQLGIKMPPSKRTMLQSRLQRRAREIGVGSVAAYHRHFFGNPESQAAELEHLLNLATTNKTDFFREPDHFDHLVRSVLPEWRKNRGGDGTFRIWCAGCSTGEEAYTLSMVLNEEAARHPFNFSILATDVSTRVLHHAMDAVYPEAHIGPIAKNLRHKYLLRSRDGENVKMGPELRAPIRFGHLNFLSPDYGIKDRIDVIFFRNVMIYFERATQEQVVGRMCRHLRPNGHLYIAHSETLQGLDLPITSVGTAIYQHTPAKKVLGTTA